MVFALHIETKRKKMKMTYNFKEKRKGEYEKILYAISITDRFSMFRFYHKVQRALDFCYRGDLSGYYSVFLRSGEYTECDYLFRTIFKHVSEKDKDAYIFENVLEEVEFWECLRMEINLIFGLNN